MKDLLSPAILARKRSSGRLLGPSAGAAVGRTYLTAYAWGRNDDGQLCLGHADRVGEPRSVVFEGAAASAADRVVLDIACGARHTMVLCEGNELFAGGASDAGQLGHSPEDQDRNKRRGQPLAPAKVRFPDIEVRRGKDALVAVACGAAHTFALTQSGRVFAWGANHSGQLGLGHFKGTPFPDAVAGLSTQHVAKIASGRFHGLALGRDGRVWSWGLGKDGRLGRGTTTTSVVPQCVTGLFASQLTVEEVHCGAEFSLVRVRQLFVEPIGGAVDPVTGFKMMRSVPRYVLLAWGSNESGQLGIRSEEPHATRPRRVLFPPSDQITLAEQAPLETPQSAFGVTLVACGFQHCVAYFKDTRQFFAWGNGESGQLGLGNGYSYNFPQDLTVFRGYDCDLLGAGARNSCSCITMNKTDRFLMAWGEGHHGQIGAKSAAAVLSTKPSGLPYGSCLMRMLPHPVSSREFATDRTCKVAMGEGTMFAVAKCRSKARWRQNIGGKQKTAVAGTGSSSSSGGGGVGGGGSAADEAQANAAQRAVFQAAAQRRAALKEFHGLSPGHPSRLCTLRDASEKPSGPLQEMYITTVGKNSRLLLCPPCHYWCYPGSYGELVLRANRTNEDRLLNACECSKDRGRKCACIPPNPKGGNGGGSGGGRLSLLARRNKKKKKK